MQLNEFLDHVNQGKTVTAGSEEHQFMVSLAFTLVRMSSSTAAVIFRISGFGH